MNQKILTNILLYVPIYSKLYQYKNKIKGDVILIESPISYPGSKRRGMNYLLTKFPSNKEIYVEPFIGSGSVYLAYRQNWRKYRECKRVILCDMNEDLIIFYKVCRDNLNELEKNLTQTIKKYLPSYEACLLAGKAKDKSKLIELQKELHMEGRIFWNQLKEFNKEEASELEIATNFLIKNRLSFNGIISESSSLSYTKLNRGQLLDVQKLKNFSYLLQGVELRAGSYEETCKEFIWNEDCFIFLDPPYYSMEASSKLYQKKNKDLFDHEQFRQWLTGVNADWLLTYDNDEHIKWSYRDCSTNIFQIQYSASNKVDLKDNISEGNELLIASKAMIDAAEDTGVVI